MTDESALLAGICSEPGDDARRLIYADWLEEHGRADRAELIRVQCALGVTPGADPARVALEVRAEELLVAHEQDWRSEAPTWARKAARFRRGFVTQVRTGVRTFVSKAGGLLKRVPVTDVQLGEFGQQVPALAACRHLGAIRDLRLEVVSLGSLASLAQSPYLGKLSGLHLVGFSDYRRPVAGLEPLLTSPALGHLAALTLHGLHSDAGGLAALVSFPAAAQLGYLKLSNNIVDDSTAERLASLPQLSGLRELDLVGSWQLTDRGLSAIAGSPHLVRLERLSLGGAQGVTDAGLRALTESPYLGALTDLDLSFTGVSDAGIDSLVSAPGLPNLSRLDVFHAKIDEARWTPWRSYRPPNLYVRVIWVRRHRSRTVPGKPAERLAAPGPGGIPGPSSLRSSGRGRR